MNKTFGGFLDNNDGTKNLKDTLTWWLGKKKAFDINSEYRLELIFIDKLNNSAKIRITNLKNNKTSDIDTNLESSND